MIRLVEEWDVKPVTRFCRSIVMNRFDGAAWLVFRGFFLTKKISLPQCHRRTVLARGVLKRVCWGASSIHWHVGSFVESPKLLVSVDEIWKFLVHVTKRTAKTCKCCCRKRKKFIRYWLWCCVWRYICSKRKENVGFPESENCIGLLGNSSARKDLRRTKRIVLKPRRRFRRQLFMRWLLQETQLQCRRKRQADDFASDCLVL